MTSFQVIQATLDHLDPLAELFDQYRQFYRQPANLDQSKAFLKERLVNGESIVFLALADDGTVLGFTQLYHWFSSVSACRKWNLNDLYVSENARRTGVGKALMDRAKELAISTNTKGIFLETEVTNTKAQALYESLGYEKMVDFYAYNWENPDFKN